MAFAVGLLDIALPRDDRPGGSFPRVMVNDACITRAVQGEAAYSVHTHDIRVPGSVLSIMPYQCCCCLISHYRYEARGVCR